MQSMYAERKRKLEEVKVSKNTEERKKKCVSSMPDTSEGNSSSTSLSNKRKYDFERFKDLWLILAQAKQFGQLKNTLATYQKSGNLEEFFKQEGGFFLRWALINTETTDQFDFICKTLPKELIQATLSATNYSLINHFLYEESNLDKFNPIDNKFNPIDNKRVTHCLEKIRLLLTITPETVKQKLAAKCTDPLISPRVKASIVQSFAEEGVALPLPHPLTFAFARANELFILPPTPPLDAELTPPASPPSPDEEITPPASPPLI